MHKTLVPLLICPICHGEVTGQIDEDNDIHILEGRFICQNCQRTYPVADGIAVFLDIKEKRNDLWKQQETFAAAFRREHPIRYFVLVRTPLGNIKPDHQFLKGLMLEDEKTLEKATRRIYTKDYMIGYEKTKQALAEVENDNPSIILEIACGRGGFFKPFIQSRHGNGVYIASDFSPTVLKSNLKWLSANELQDQVTWMAFDAKSMPFRGNSIPAAVSNLGFPNIQSDGKAVVETFRVLAPKGKLLTNFMFTSEETANYAKARELGLEQFYLRRNVEDALNRAGFKFSLEELHSGPVRPTPGGIDMLPVEPDTYSFCVIRAEKPE